MNPKLRWLLLIIPLALFAWAYQAASWRPKLVGAQPGIGKPSRSDTSKDRLLLSPDGKQLVSYWEHYSNGYQISTAVWDVPARRMLWQQQRSDGLVFQPLAFSPDGRILAGTQFGFVGVGAFPIVLCEAATGRKIREIPVKTLEPPLSFASKTRNPLANFGAHSAIQSVAFPSNLQIVVSNAHAALVADTQTSKTIRQWNFKLPALASDKLPPPPQSHISGDGATVIALSNGAVETAVAIYDSKTGKQRGQWIYESVFRNPRLSPDGTLWAMELANEDTPNFYDAKTGKRLWDISYIASNHSHWIWSADSKQVVSSLNDYTETFDARTGGHLKQRSVDNVGQALALDPRGDTLYTLDNTGKIWRWRLR